MAGAVCISMTCPSLQASYAALFGCGQFLVDPKWLVAIAGQSAGIRGAYAGKLAIILTVLFILIGPRRQRHRDRYRIQCFGDRTAPAAQPHWSKQRMKAAKLPRWSQTMGDSDTWFSLIPESATSKNSGVKLWASLSFGKDVTDVHQVTVGLFVLGLLCLQACV